MIIAKHIKAHLVYGFARRAYSVGEVMVVVGILGILAAIAIPSLTSAILPSKQLLAQNIVESLNQSVIRFNASNYELLFPGVAPSGQDEMLILRTMQFKDPDPNKAKIGAPYVRDDWNPDISNSTQDFRVVWMGNLFKLAPPGTAGTGIKVKFDASDITTPFVFPPGFNMAGK